MNKNIKVIPILLIISVFIITAVVILCLNRPKPSTSIPLDQKAQIFYKDNIAKIKKPNKEEWQEIIVDSKVKDGDQIMTGTNSNVEIKFGKESNNYIKIAQNSKAIFTTIDSKNEKTLDLKHGKLYMLINNIEPKSSFKVKTPTAIGGARGTGWTIEVSEKNTTVKTFEGNTYIQALSPNGSVKGEELPLNENTKSTVESNAAPNLPAPVTNDEKKDWQEWKDGLAAHLFRPFVVYIDKDSPNNHYTPSGWIGDYDAIKMVQYTENTHSGSTCLKFIYTGKSPQGAGYAGVYWQNPVNNWGSIKGGHNLTGAKKITFWARGENGGEVIEKFKVGGIYGTYGDTAIAWIGPITLSKDWQRYEIDLSGLDLSYMSGGFSWFVRKVDNPQGAIFYLDDIIYE